MSPYQHFKQVAKVARRGKKNRGKKKGAGNENETVLRASVMSSCYCLFLCSGPFEEVTPVVGRCKWQKIGYFSSSELLISVEARIVAVARPQSTPHLLLLNKPSWASHAHPDHRWVLARGRRCQQNSRRKTQSVSNTSANSSQVRWGKRFCVANIRANVDFGKAVAVNLLHM